MTSPRLCAYEIIHDTFSKGAYPNLLYKEKAKGLDERDRKFVTLVVNDTLANVIHIDYILSHFTKGKRVNAPVRDILRMAIDQLKFLDFPEHAVINESVDLCSKIGKSMLKGFVNGVLRNYVRNKDITYPEENSLEYYSIVNSKPMWLMELWEKDYGFENAILFSKVRHSNTSVHTAPGFDAQEWFDSNGFSYKPIHFIKNAYELDGSYGLYESEEFKQGKISIQGVGSMTACVALSPQGGEKVLDACSAPGGKTVYICEKMGHGEVLSCDLYDGRLRLVDDNLKRCGISFASTKKEDMSQFNKDYEKYFDRVLVDAPCSGLGVINSKPDIILNKCLDDVYELSKIQYSILTNCSKYVKDGGVLVYSTCTINRIENDKVVQKFLSRNTDFELDQFELDDGTKIEKGTLQLTPDKYEGFYVARFKRV